MPKQNLMTDLEEQEYFDSLSPDQKFGHLAACNSDDICTVLKNFNLMIALGFHITANPERHSENLNNALYYILGINVKYFIERGLEDAITHAIRDKDKLIAKQQKLKDC